MFGPVPEIRTLDSIRPSLRDPHCSGPEAVYAIAMDVGLEPHRRELQERMLLFGVVTYAAGRLGQEPVRSQGHVHRVSSHSGWSPPELYEVWSGKAVILMQEHAADDPGRCFAVYAGKGETVLVPPGWAHATISADPSVPLTFGAWCDREYGFEYAAVRARGGLAHFPLLSDDGRLRFEFNPRYARGTLVEKKPRTYSEFGIEPGVPIYEQFARNPGRFQFVSKPGEVREKWAEFTP
jgi:glucose-6-phosphate isomerase